MKKKKHILRNAIIITLVSIVSIVLLGFLAVGIVICDFTDDTPSYISEVEGVDTKTFIDNKVKDSIKNCGLFDDYEFLFDERDFNDLLATITPLIKIDNVNLKSIYLNIDSEDNIKAYAPFSIAFYKSCGKVDGLLTYDSETLKLDLSLLKVNLLESTHGILKEVISDELVNNIQTTINDEGICLNMVKEENDVVISMTNIDLCKTIINCSEDSKLGFLEAALVAGALNSKNVEIVANKNGKTGIIIHRLLLSKFF